VYEMIWRLYIQILFFRSLMLLFAWAASADERTGSSGRPPVYLIIISVYNVGNINILLLLLLLHLLIGRMLWI